MQSPFYRPFHEDWIHARADLSLESYVLNAISLCVVDFSADKKKGPDFT